MKNNNQTGLILSVICLILQSIAFAEYPAQQGNQKSETILEGMVADIVTGRPVAGATVSVAGESCSTDAKGHYSITGLSPGVSRMEITGEFLITRSLTVVLNDHTSLDVTVKLSDFNNAMFWASANHAGHIMRWRIPPKWVLYTHVLDSMPPKEFAPRDRQYLFQIIQRELPEITSFFNDPQIELFKGRPNDDPRWTGQTSADGFILCAPAAVGGGHASWKAPGYWVRYATIRNNYERAPKVWRHEIAHALGMAHAFDNQEWLPLGVKDPNYRQTKLHDKSEVFTDWDKLWLHCVYSGPRPASNTPPDCDPNNFIHGKDKI